MLCFMVEFVGCISALVHFASVLSGVLHSTFTLDWHVLTPVNDKSCVACS